MLGASNYTYAEARWSERLADWIRAHFNALAFLGGVPKLLVCDHLRTKVTAACRYEPGIDHTHQQIAAHDDAAVLPTRVRCPCDEVKVEVAVAVLIVERFILARLRHRRFLSPAEFNEAIREVLGDPNARFMRKLARAGGSSSRRSRWTTVRRDIRACEVESFRRDIVMSSLSSATMALGGLPKCQTAWKRGSD